VRSETYAKLKHKQKVRMRVCFLQHKQRASQEDAAAVAVGRDRQPVSLLCAYSHTIYPSPMPPFSNPQKQKRQARKKRDAAEAKAEELGLEPPQRKQQKVSKTVSRRQTACCKYLVQAGTKPAGHDRGAHTILEQQQRTGLHPQPLDVSCQGE
jgi:hypothetical protein